MYILDEKRPFSQSRLWQLQRDYFSQAGIEAWRTGEVPYYITSNPVVGKTYAELVKHNIQAKSTMGAANDAHEQEADRVAAQVVSGSSSARSGARRQVRLVNSLNKPPNRRLQPNCCRPVFQPALAGKGSGKWVTPCPPAIG